MDKKRAEGTPADSAKKFRGNSEQTLEELRDEVASLLLEVGEMEDRKQNPMKYFVPTGDQERLIREVGLGGEDGKKWIHLMTAANSIGKTAVTIVMLGNLIWGPQSEWFRMGRFARWPFRKKFWYMSEKHTLRSTVVGTGGFGEFELQRWFPFGRYSLMKSGYEYWSQFTSDTGWTGQFKSYDLEPEAFASEKIGLAVFDEPPPEAVYNEVLARLTMGGVILMPMTPLMHSAWTMERLIPQADGGGPVSVFQAEIEGACRQHGVRGFLEHQQVMDIVGQYDPDERAAREKGVYAHLIGLVYKGLHPAVHRHSRSVSEFVQSEYTIINVVDPHDRRAPFVAWFAEDRMGRLWAVDEFPSRSEFGPYHDIQNWKLTTREVCERIRSVEMGHGWDPRSIFRVMDPNFGRTTEPVVGKTVEDIFYEYGVEMGWPLMYWTEVEDSLSMGHIAVKDFFAIGAEKERVRLFIGEGCENLWHDLTHYTWRESGAKRADVDGKPERVNQKYKDGADVVRYAVMAASSPERPVVSESGEAKPEHYGMYEKRSRTGGWRDPHSV